MIRIHGTAVALGGDGVLLRGPSGCGKSDLALRLVDGGARLVADDQTELHWLNNEIRLRAPALAGRLEVRGVGLVRVAAASSAPLRLVVDLVAPAVVERLPEPRVVRYFERDVPLLALAPFEASAPAKLRLALVALAAARSPDWHVGDA